LSFCCIPERKRAAARFFVPGGEMENMGIFTPSALKERVTDISPELLREMGVRALLLDVDNTIAPYSSRVPAAGAEEWAKSLCRQGFRVVIVSNNYKKRVGRFAAGLGLDFISFALKPLPAGYIRAARRLKTPLRECAVIGDQIFTDILGANLCGMRSVLLSPIEPEEGLSFRLRRYFERGLREKIAKRKDVLK